MPKKAMKNTPPRFYEEDGVQIMRLDGNDYKRGAHGFAFMRNGLDWVRTQNTTVIKLLGARKNREKSLAAVD